MVEKHHIRPKRTNSYDPEIREIIAWRIAEARKNAYPHTGGLTKCATEFGISPQQWSQYERGHRSPEDHNLERIAAHLKTTVQKLMTPPENWHALKKEWVAGRSTKGRKKAAKPEYPNPPAGQTSAMPGAAPEQVSPQNAPPAANAEPRVPVESDHGSRRPQTLDLIRKLAAIDKLGSEGKISPENLASTYKSLDVLIDALYREVSE